VIVVKEKNHCNPLNHKNHSSDKSNWCTAPFKFAAPDFINPRLQSWVQAHRETALAKASYWITLKENNRMVQT
jgi:hypothetical protein